jgi:hypothetical protein
VTEVTDTASLVTRIEREYLAAGAKLAGEFAV